MSSATILFVGDIVGEPGLAYLEQHLPTFIERHNADFVIANAENIAMSVDDRAPGHCGMKPNLMERLFAAGVDCATGGNHSWDGDAGMTIHADERILRPLNYGSHLPGRGAGVITKNGVRLGVVNVAGRTALPEADAPYDALLTQLDSWGDAVDLALVDIHSSSVNEKVTFGFAFAGRVIAMLGTHTHVPTLDMQIIPGGTAYCTDVGMTGPRGGVQGYDAQLFIDALRRRYPGDRRLELAVGPVELGAVVVTVENGEATAIERIATA